MSIKSRGFASLSGSWLDPLDKRAPEPEHVSARLVTREAYASDLVRVLLQPKLGFA
jgi:hypothetical protein